LQALHWQSPGVQARPYLRHAQYNLEQWPFLQVHRSCNASSCSILVSRFSLRTCGMSDLLVLALLEVSLGIRSDNLLSTSYEASYDYLFSDFLAVDGL
jgi:hypothetical protein